MIQKYKINIQQLYTYIEKTVSEQSNFVFSDSLCKDDSIYEIKTDTQKIKSLDKTLYIPFSLEHDFEDQGIYDCAEDCVLSIKQVELDDDYIVSGQSDSQIDKVTSLDGQMVLNLNYSDDVGKFSGIIEKTDEYVLYVINANKDQNGRISKTGVFYVDSFDDGTTTFFYYPKFYNKTGDFNEFYYKNEKKHKWVADEDVFSSVFVDRGNSINVQGIHQSLEMVNTLEDFDGINIQEV